MSDKAAVLMIGLALGVVVGGLLGRWGLRSEINADAIKAGVGEYDRDTGNFRWRPLVETTDE